MELRNWVLHYRNEAPLPCTAPCSLTSVLLAAGKIGDPFYGTNERDYQHLSEFPCAFTSVFTVDAVRARNELIFSGLDTLCEIDLNGNLLGKTANMHRTYRFEAGEFLKVGENTLTLRFEAPLPYFDRKNKEHFLFTAVECYPGAAHLRKPLCMSGWDWGPTLPDMGIQGGVTLDAYDAQTDRIEDFIIRQHHENGKVRLTFSLTTRHSLPGCKATVTADGKTVVLEKGKGEITVDNPKIWWPNGYGEQPLYPVTAALTANGEKIDECRKQIGLRTVTVSRRPDSEGEEFCFVVNGVKIFAMGANYVPLDSIFPRVTDRDIDRCLENCVAAHFNSLRVWGGGAYPPEHFYDKCDELGLLIWQDFMIACANVRLTEEFLDNITPEYIGQMKRIAHRASLGLLCGNNEMELAVLTWENAGGDEVKRDYLELYEKILPALCQSYAPDVFYWPSSPSSGGGFDDPGSYVRGDQHFWAVWHGNCPFTDYRNHKFRFCSEFGFESLPSMKTIRAFCPPEEENPFSFVMENHQKCGVGNSRILGQISENYLYPSSFAHYVYTSQILQADAIKYGVEYFRRLRGFCMGSIYWQLNDCWPVSSWSSVDYFGRWKALHYAAKKFYAPVACALFYEEGVIRLNVANETRADAGGTLKMTLCRADFTVLDAFEGTWSVPALTSRDVASLSDHRLDDPRACYLYADLYDANGLLIMRQTLLFIKPKHFKWQNPAIKAAVSDIPGGVSVTLTASAFAKSVCVDFAEADVVFSDNFVDLTSPEPLTLTAKTDLNAAVLQEQLQILSVYDIDK